MKVCIILLNICLPYYNFVISTCIRTSGFIFTSDSAIMFSSPTNLVCASISKCCILDTSSFGVGIASTFSCYWIFCGFFSSWPPLLRSCVFSRFISFSWTAPLLRSYGSSICTSSSWVVPLSLTSISSSCLDTSVLVGLPLKSRNCFW